MKQTLALLSLVVVAACEAHGSAPVTAQPPDGEVWLTPQQIREAKLEIAPVANRSVGNEIVTSGKVAFDDLRVAHIFSPVTGRVTKILADPGQRLKRGAPLATIESPDVGNAFADLGKAQADLIAAQHDLARQQELYEAHAGSQKELEASQDNFGKAKAEMDRARQKARLLHSGTANADTQEFTLRAPIEGEVVARNVNPGAEVQGQYSGGATQELFTIGEIDKVWVLGDLYEMDIGRVKIGAPAAVSVVAYKDKVFNGQVDWVSGMLDPATRTAKVRCTFDNPDRLLRPEMYATVQISVDQKKALAIPRNALLRLGEYKVVFVEIADGAGLRKFERLPVDVDEGEASAWLEVKHGIAVGQSIVVSGAILLSQRL